MEKLRIYGKEPYFVVVVSGGPGAPGSMAQVARELSKYCGVLEPLHIKDSIDGQLAELKTIIDEFGCKPVILIGHSWGAWTSYIFASKYPRLVKKVILVSSGSFTQEYLKAMNNERTNRLNEEENKRVSELFKLLNDNNINNKKDILSEFGKLMSKTDSYAIINEENETLDFLANVFNKCMKEITDLRKSGKLLNYGLKIKCSVIAINGEDDPHQYLGVKEPLTKVLKDFKFFLLKKCGHYPWNEIYAKDKFYKILTKEIKLEV